MDNTTQSELALFTANVQAINKDLFGQSLVAKRLAALLYAQAGKTIDCESIQQCHALIKQNTGAFSAFRNVALYVAPLLSLSPNPQGTLDEALKVYTLFKDMKLFPSIPLVVAAYQIAAQVNTSEYEKVTTQVHAYYDYMNAREFFYFGRDDYIFAAMLGLVELDAASGAIRIEEIFNRLKGEFINKDSVRPLAQVLVLGSQDDSEANRVLSLRNALRAKKIKLDKSYTFPALGIFALLPVDIDTIVRDIDEMQAALRREKGFGVLSVPKQELLLYVASLTAGKYIHNIRNRTLTATPSTSITNIDIAQQAYMITACFAIIAAISSTS